MSDRTATARRPLGLRLIIAYKLVKGPVMLALALMLTFGRGEATVLISHLIRQLAEGGWLLHRLGEWLGVHVTASTLHGGAILAWLDAGTTALEATLLLLGKPWGEWLVVAGLGALIPLEVYWLGSHFTPTRLAVLGVNSAVFAYLFWRRWRHIPPRLPTVPLRA